jgi:hypothetical protein
VCNLPARHSFIHLHNTHFFCALTYAPVSVLHLGPRVNTSNFLVLTCLYFVTLCSFSFSTFYFFLSFSYYNTLLWYIRSCTIHPSAWEVGHPYKVSVRLPFTIPPRTSPFNVSNCTTPASVTYLITYGPNQCIQNFPGCCINLLSYSNTKSPT